MQLEKSKSNEENRVTNNSLLAGRYRIDSLLAVGGFGNTYLAVDEHKPSQPQCVVKQFASDRLSQLEPAKYAKCLDLFYRESSYLESLGKHPQIPTLLARFSCDDRHYLVEEYIPGHHLGKELEADGIFDENRLRDFLNNILPALAFIHRHQIVHRDIKPENIIRRSDNCHLVILDFGAAKALNNNPDIDSHTQIGTCGYIAPEQSFGRSCLASDIYSLGMTCLHLLTGQSPPQLYDPISQTLIWQDFLSTPIDDRFAVILGRTIAFNPHQRYPDVSSLRQDLKNLSHPTKINLTKPIAKTIPNTPSTWQTSQNIIPKTLQVLSLAFNRDGKYLICGNHGQLCQIWQVKDGSLYNQFSAHDCGVASVTTIVEGTGEKLITGSVAGTIKIWNFPELKLEKMLGGHSTIVTELIGSSDGKYLASFDGDRHLKLWDLSAYRCLYQSTRDLSILSLAAADDRGLLATLHYPQTVYLWDFQTGKTVDSIELPIGNWTCLTFLPQSSNLVILDATGKLLTYNTASSQPLKTTNIPLFHPTKVRSIAANTIVAIGRNPSYAVIWDLENDRLIPSPQLDTPLRNVLATSIATTAIANSQYNNQIAIWQST
jgi:serine/threonine protein kinase